jgi:hypothetical protein
MTVLPVGYFLQFRLPGTLMPSMTVQIPGSVYTAQFR